MQPQKRPLKTNQTNTFADIFPYTQTNSFKRIEQKIEMGKIERKRKIVV